MVSTSLLRTVKQTVKHALAQRVLREDELRRAKLPSIGGGLPPELWDARIDAHGELLFGDVPLNQLAAEFGTPLHVVDRRRLESNVRNFLAPFAELGSQVALATSYKTNPLPGVLSVLHEAGTWAEVISHFELWLALRLGVDPSRILFNGPGKDAEGIDLAVQHGIRLINADSREELDRIADSARRQGRVQDVGLRVVASVGWSGQFGLSMSRGDAWDAMRNLKREPWLQPRGLHLHLGTGLKDRDLYLQAIRETLEFGRRLASELDIVIDCYDFGGGFGVPTVRTRDDWDARLESLGHPARLALPDDCPKPAEYAAAILPLIREFFPAGNTVQPQFLFEPGRAITSDAQLLLLSVLGTKPAPDGVTQVIFDGGKNVALPLEWETHQIFATSRLNESETPLHDLFGPLCHPGDVLCRRRKFPRLRAGDVVAVMDAGAYFVPNQMNFSLPRPAAVLLEEGQPRVIRRRERFEDLVHLDDWPREARHA